MADTTRNALRKKWNGMKFRCNDKSNKNYGGKGIKVCEEWQNFDTFYEWAISTGYESGLTIDRIDNSKCYSPNNCRWATPKQQANNTTRNTFIEWNGETHTIMEWADITGISNRVIEKRIKLGWEVQDILTTPVKKLLQPIDRNGDKYIYKSGEYKGEDRWRVEMWLDGKHYKGTRTYHTKEEAIPERNKLYDEINSKRV